MKQPRTDVKKTDRSGVASPGRTGGGGSPGGTKPEGQRERHWSAFVWILCGGIGVLMLAGVILYLSPSQLPANRPEEKGELPLFGPRSETPMINLSSEEDDSSASESPVDTVPSNRLPGKLVQAEAPSKIAILSETTNNPVSEANIPLALKLHESQSGTGDLRASTNLRPGLQRELENKFSRVDREIYGFIMERWEKQKRDEKVIPDESILREAAQRFGITPEKARTIFADLDSYIFLRQDN